MKLDGYRCIALKRNNDVELYSRNGKPFGQFPNIFDAVREQPPKSFVIDDEIVVLDADGRSNFNLLQRWGCAPIAVHFYAFDLIHLKSVDLRSRPLAERQALADLSHMQVQWVNWWSENRSEKS